MIGIAKHYDITSDFLLCISDIPVGTAEDFAIEKRLRLTTAAIRNITLCHEKDIDPENLKHVTLSHDGKEYTGVLLPSDDGIMARLHSELNIVDKFIGSEDFLSLVSAIGIYASKKNELESKEANDNFFRSAFTQRKELPENAAYLSPKRLSMLNQFVCQERFGKILEDVAKKIITEMEVADNA